MSNHLLRASFLIGAAVLASTAAAQSRGERLYATRCVACHTTQVHWRDRRLATDWRSLQAQVVRWQAAGRLNWSPDDVREVTQYLNESFYGFRSPSTPVAATGTPAAKATTTPKSEWSNAMLARLDRPHEFRCGSEDTTTP
jgi:hypothetical protein